jgi:hypothetical protein
MATQRTFGHRATVRPQTLQIKPHAPVERSDEPDIEHISATPYSLPPEEQSIDDELQEWKRARRKAFEIPWRQLSVMAGLCFGIASFVLPDSVNDDLRWLLYALMAASFYAGLRKRKRPQT